MPITGADTARSSYAAGKARADANRTQLWANALTHSANFAGSIIKQATELSEAIDKAADSKIQEGLDKDLYGYSKGDTKVNGKYYDVLSLKDDTTGEVPSPELIGQAYDTLHDEVFNADYISENYGVTRRQAERFLEEYGDSYEKDFLRVKEQGTYKAMQTWRNTGLQGKLNTLISDPDLTMDEIYDEYESYRATFPESSFSYANELSLDDPTFRASAFSVWSTTHAKSLYEESLKNPGVNKASIKDQILSEFDNAMSGFSNLSAAQQGEIATTRASLESNLMQALDGMETEAVWDTNSRFAAAEEMIAQQRLSDPTWIMTDDDYKSILNQVGLKPDSNYLHYQKAQELYSTSQTGNIQASNQVVDEWLANPDNLRALDEAWEEEWGSFQEDGTVNRATYVYEEGRLNQVDDEGNVINRMSPSLETPEGIRVMNPSEAGIAEEASEAVTAVADALAGSGRTPESAPSPMAPATLTRTDRQMRPTSAAVDMIISDYNRLHNTASGARTIIATDYSGIVEQFPEEWKDNPETMLYAIEKLNEYAGNRVSQTQAGWKNTALATANSIYLTDEEKRTQLAEMHARKLIDDASYEEALGKIDFPYKDEYNMIVGGGGYPGILKSRIKLLGGDDELLNSIVGNVDFEDNLQAWLIAGRTSGLSLQAMGVEGFLDTQIGIYMNGNLVEEGASATRKAISEMLRAEDLDLMIGDADAYKASTINELLARRDDGDLSLIMSEEAVSAVRSQMALADTTSAVDVNTLSDTAAGLIYGRNYDDLGETEKNRVDVNVALAVADQYTSEMLRDTFIQGLGLDENNWREVSIKTQDGSRLGIVASDGFVYYLPSYSFDGNQYGACTYLGTDSETYKNLISGQSDSIDVSGRGMAYYSKPSFGEFTANIRPENDASSMNAVDSYRDFISISETGDVTIDPRIYQTKDWTEQDDTTLQHVMDAIAQDPEYKSYYYKIRDSLQAQELNAVNQFQRQEMALSEEYNIKNDPFFKTSQKSLVDAYNRSR